MFSAPVVISREEPKSPSTGKHNVNTIKEKKSYKEEWRSVSCWNLDSDDQYAKQKQIQQFGSLLL